MLRRLRIPVIVFSLVAALSGVGLAGARWNNSLTIGQDGHFAGGGFSETHNTPDVTEYAQCGSNSTTGFCMFVTTRNQVYSCFTTDPGHIAVIRSMGAESTFQATWNDSGECTYVLAYTTSTTVPKTQ
jgi:hypothetical protein